MTNNNKTPNIQTNNSSKHTNNQKIIENTTAKLSQGPDSRFITQKVPGQAFTQEPIYPRQSITTKNKYMCRSSLPRLQLYQSTEIKERDRTSLQWVQ
ncbi:hypothetical protein HanXRQr2_Chr16g0750531 [Helianthus annuus]|uniref:Uncharacterized protein n=1 Tax=Helianthus annuus TaxID=4232 RepID=A0A9K3DTU2_HELAN|nr:hypothetical protein HanXRQr2_Chr16g0750531 [Helianthus annuus]